MRLAVLVAFLPLPCLAEQPHAQEIQRAVMQLDQRSAEFARGVSPQPLPAAAGQPLHADPVIAREWRPYERMKAAGGVHELRLSPPVVLKKPEPPLPLPGGARHGVEPIASTGVGG